MDTILELTTTWTLDPQQDWDAIRARYEAMGQAILDMIQGDFDLPFAQNGFTGLEVHNVAATDMAIRAMYCRDRANERVNWLKEGF